MGPGVTRTIEGRMAEAIALLEVRSGGRRSPKAFYLHPADWIAFRATEREKVETSFGNNPTILVIDLAFNGVPVRESTGAQSRLYDNTGAGRALPQ